MLKQENSLQFSPKPMYIHMESLVICTWTSKNTWREWYMSCRKSSFPLRGAREIPLPIPCISYSVHGLLIVHVHITKLPISTEINFRLRFVLLSHLTVSIFNIVFLNYIFKYATIHPKGVWNFSSSQVLCTPDLINHT